jgi:D-alanyl-lipoteichoic acid acyltransferase DltB (MBOAT superfamily)
MLCEKRRVLKRLPLKLRHGIAFFVTLLITEYMLGFWHGAGWNFGLFSIFHAFAIWIYYLGRHR